MVILNFIAKINSIEFIMQAICFHLMCYTAYFEISQQYFGLSYPGINNQKFKVPHCEPGTTQEMYSTYYSLCVLQGLTAVVM